jgi:hypothetical protein
LLIERAGYRIPQYQVKGGKCFHCKAPIDGVGL